MGLLRTARSPGGYPLPLDKHGVNLSAKGRNHPARLVTARHDAILYALSKILQKTGLKFRIEDSKSFEHTRAHPIGTIRPDISIFINGSWRFYDLKTICHGTNLFKAPHREGEALLHKQTYVNSHYYRHATRLDNAMGDNRCVDLLRNHGRVRGLIVDTRGAISGDFTEFIKMCAKEAAYEHWDEMGAASLHLAEQTYLQLFRRAVGVTAVREGAKWMRNALNHYIDLKNGRPRGEDARTFSRLRAAERQHRRDYLDCFYHGRNQHDPHRA